MEFDVSYDPERRWVVVTVRGDWEREADLRMVAETMDAMAKHDCTTVLVDERELRTDAVSLGGTFGHIKKVVEEYEGLPLYTARVAMVADESRRESYGFMETVASNRGVTVRFFTDMDEATGWLAGDSQQLGG